MRHTSKTKLPTYSSFPGSGPPGKYCAGCDYIRPLVKRGEHFMAAPPGTVKWCSKLERPGIPVAADAQKPAQIGALLPTTQACKHFEDLRKRKTEP